MRFPDTQASAVPAQGLGDSTIKSATESTAESTADSEPGLRAPSTVMRLERLGAFHASRLSFLRVLLRRIHQQAWSFSRPVWRIDADGYGVATYQAESPERTYTLIAFSHKLADSDRSDRVIAEAWDTTFTLFDGIPDDDDLKRLSGHVPKQEAGRISQQELILSRANKSVRLFNYVVDCLASGEQPDAEKLTPVGYLMRTTAVYGSSKFGAADRSLWADRAEFSGSFQPEMLSVWLIRTFTVDLVNHIAGAKAPATAVKLNADIRRSLGVGNSTGLGMAPFLVNHPLLLHRWIHARETALARVRSIEIVDNKVMPAKITKLLELIQWNKDIALQWQTEHKLQQTKIEDLLAGMDALQKRLESSQTKWHSSNTPEGENVHPWNQLYIWAEEQLPVEAQELLASLLIELYPDEVDQLAQTMCIDEQAAKRIDGKMPIDEFAKKLEQLYNWAINQDFSTRDSIARVWYVSASKLEPRLGERFEEPLEPFEQPLAPARAINELYKDLKLFGNQYTESTGTTAGFETATLAEFLMFHPQHRHAAKRVFMLEGFPYAELRDNTIASDMLPIDMLRCKLSFFGATKFDPRSDRWLRITLFQYAPYPDEINTMDPDLALMCLNS